MAASIPALGGSASNALSVNITLSAPSAAQSRRAAPGLFTSAALSDATGALVHVVCQSGHFVSISPQPGGRFIDTHGGAYAFYPAAASPAVRPHGEVITRSGTVTSFRVYSLEHLGDRLDVLVSF